MHKSIFYLFVLFLTISTPLLATAPTTNYSSLWKSLLKTYVHINVDYSHLVDYKMLKTDTRFKQLIDLLETIDISELSQINDKKAFWINMYNIAAINIILKDPTKRSIKDHGRLFTSVWNIPAITIAHTPYTLDTIEHKILRSMKDPRCHFALVCASLSCPSLQPYAFDSAHIDTQLNSVTKAFLHNHYKGLSYNAQNQTLYLSKLFQWFSDDFKDHGGPLSFISSYIDIPKYDRIGYLDYDWSLNIVSRKDAP